MEHVEKHIRITEKQLRRATGQELLLLAVFGDQQLAWRIDDELDRRAYDAPLQVPAVA